MNARLRTVSLYLVFLLSGFAGLGYQIAWLKMFLPGLGHEMPATLAIVCAFMGGMALGAWLLNARISRATRPGAWYASLEAILGVWAFVSILLIPKINQMASGAVGLDPSAMRQWGLSFLMPFLVLLPSTAAMGATFPAMERFVAPLTMDGKCVGAIYAANTFGAVSGVLLSAFVILPALGLQRSVCCFGIVNLLCSAAALALAGRSTCVKETPATPQSAARLRNMLTIFCTGLLGIGYETAGIRVLSQVLENTVYTFAVVLSVFLAGTTIGAASYQRWWRRRDSPVLLSELLCGISFAAMLGILMLGRSQALYNHCRQAFGDSSLGVLAAEATVALAIFGLPTVFMGALFSHLTQQAQSPEGGVGQFVALNTLGGALAPALFGVLLFPAVGAKWTLTLISLGYLALLPIITRRRWVMAILPLGLLLTLPANLHIVQMPPGGKITAYREGIMASVAVVEDDSGNKTLRVDNRFQMGGTAAADAEYRHAHIPLLLHPAPKRALFLGLGTGITFGAASLHTDLLSDGVELVPEVLAVMRQFEPFNYAPINQPSLRLHVADARRFVRADAKLYDVIVADLFHPARDGAGSLYTLEHFQAIRQRLASDGLFCQWLPLHQLDDSMLRIIIRTFLQVYPETEAYLLRFNVDAPVMGLVGSLERRRYSAEWIEQQARARQLEKELKRLGLSDPVRFFGTFVCGAEDLRNFSAAAPINTDDHPYIAFGAPRFTYQKRADSYGRLMSLLEQISPDPVRTLEFGTSAQSKQFTARLANYIKARNVYLKGLVHEVNGERPQAIDAFLESARLSDDFTSGYAQCLTIASLEAKANPTKARGLLQRLVDAQPNRPVAAEMLKRLGEQ